MRRFFPLADSSVVRRQAAASRPGAFTLVELLMVIAVIAILAGLSLAAMGGVQKKAIRSRAQTELAALAAAIDSYFLDRGVYPTTDAGALHAALCPRSTGKIYFEPKSSMLRTNGDNVIFIDPWGNDYRYEIGSGIRNVGSFDLWTTAGTPDEDKDDIRN